MRLCNSLTSDGRPFSLADESSASCCGPRTSKSGASAVRLCVAAASQHHKTQHHFFLPRGRTVLVVMTVATRDAAAPRARLTSGEWSRFSVEEVDLRYGMPYVEMVYQSSWSSIDAPQFDAVTGALMAKTGKHNHSFEEDRFQYWLRDTSRPSTLLEVPGRKQYHLQWVHTHMKDRESHARARARETPEQRELRLKKDRERHAERCAQLRAQGLPCNIKTEQPYLDANEIERRRKLNREAQQRWHDRLTDEKKKQLLQIWREEYYPTERRQKRNRPHHEKKRGRRCTCDVYDYHCEKARNERERKELLHRDIAVYFKQILAPQFPSCTYLHPVFYTTLSSLYCEKQSLFGWFNDLSKVEKVHTSVDAYLLYIQHTLVCLFPFTKNLDTGAWQFLT